jgi:hypothetical protein
MNVGVRASAHRGARSGKAGRDKLGVGVLPANVAFGQLGASLHPALFGIPHR